VPRCLFTDRAQSRSQEGRRGESETTARAQRIRCERIVGRWELRRAVGGREEKGRGQEEEENEEDGRMVNRREERVYIVA